MMRCISYPSKLTHIGHGRPYAGLWVGDYAAHGVEFLLFLQRSPSTLEAVKLTGDSHVPSGEFSFVAPNIQHPSRVCNEVEFHGCNAYPGNGQIAGWSFSTPRWIVIECTPLLNADG
jgi:hypothetical protein